MRNIQIIVSLNAPESLHAEELARLVREAVASEVDAAPGEHGAAQIEIVDVVAA